MASYKESKNAILNNRIEFDMESSSVATFSSLLDDFILCEDGRYEIYYDYIDTALSKVDILKNITVDKSQLNITQETNSQYMPFEIPRYWDGIDLMNMLIQVHYVNSKKQSDVVTVINVKSNSEYIRFGWLIDGNVTAVSGNVTFEITAIGTNEKNKAYKWKTRPNGTLNILESLSYDGIIRPGDDWYTSFETTMLGYVSEAKQYAQEAKASADSVDVELIKTEVKDSVIKDVTTIIGDTLVDYDTSLEVDEKIEELRTFCENIDSLSQLNVTYDDVSGKLSFYDKKSETETILISEVTINGLANLRAKYEVVDGKGKLSLLNGEEEITSVEIGDVNPSAEWTSSFREAIKTDITTAVSTLEGKVDSNKEIVDADLQGIHAAIDDLPETLATDYYNKEVTDALLADKANTSELNTVKSSIETIETSVDTNRSNITTLGEKITSVESALGEIDKSPRKTYEATYDEEQIYTLWEIENKDTEDEIRTPTSQFKISGGSGGGSTSSVLKIERITTSPLTVTVNDKAVIKYKFSGTDSSGDTVTEGAATWKMGNTVIAQNIAVDGENSFDVTEYLSVGTQKFTLIITDDAGSLVTKTWTVQQIDIRLESSFNDKLTYRIGEISFDYIPYGAISKDIHFILDGVELEKVTTSASGVPMSYTLPSQNHGDHLLEVYITAEINGSTIESNHIFKDIIWYDENSDIPVIGCIQSNFTVKQYDTTNIVYTVYDPNTETPRVTLAIDGDIISTLVLDANTQTWQYKSSTVGEHVLTITCGKTVKTLIATVEKLDIDIEPITAGLVFDFNPSGRSNNDENRLWTNGKVSMTVSDNFDWVNGGYQIDEDGDQYFCVKAGTVATIDYKLFEDDAKRNGKEFKLIFKTTNIRNADATFLSCLDGNDAAKIGIQMNVHETYIHASADNLYLPYSEEDIIEFEFNINKNTDDIPMLMGYEDGVPTRPLIYSEGHSFSQINPKVITIGSEDCDVFIYRFKVYNTALTDRGILNNFIADARNAEEMIARYTRNQIYDENSALTPEVLAESCPDLRIIKIDAPWFTNDKKDKVTGTTIQCIYKGGDPILDNWTAYNCQHSGQGTSSNEYGAAGRNMDLIMNKSGVDGIKPYIILGDGTTNVNKISLTRNSIDTNYLNVKVNIASSENANNALFARRYNEYNPYVRTAKKNNPKVKDCMEFQNCVIFVRENNPDISTHREFDDCEWHYYSLGNVGDSKKTDDTRMDDPNDKLECVLEIMDYNLPLSEFPKGEEALALLDADQFDEEGTYGWRYRYESDDSVEDNQILETINEKWREFYRFVVNSTDDEFYANLKDYFVVDSALFYYLFTERYTMVDNRAKNSFWHYGKCEDGIYRWDLTMAYDMDTSLGIGNTGKLNIPYGKEDIDYYVENDPSSSYIYRAAESTFFCRLRDLFKTEMQQMFVQCESKGAWSSSGLINQFDKHQSQFPEELWRLDIERKYIRTYKNGATRFLTEMANGRKKYQRRQFERNQEMYFATKYFGTTATSDQIMMRFNNPVDATIPQDFTLYITPYSNMYISVKYGNVTPTNFRAKAGIEYTIPYGIESNTADITLIYGASFIQAIGDLSKCYVGDNDFSKASKLQRLVIGSNAEGYANNYLTQLKFGNNRLLEYLDIQNTPALTSIVDLNGCKNMTELYANGSGVTGIVFANGGKIHTAELPAIGSAVMKNLAYLTNLDIISYDNLHTLTIENCSSIDAKYILEQGQNINRVRITGINWTLNNTALLDRIYKMYGKDNNGYNIPQSVLAGTVHVPVMREKLLEQYKAAWPDLEVTYDTMITQYTVKFINADENHTILDTQYVDKGGNAVDPITREDNPIPIPTIPSTISTDFTFKEWNESLDSIFSDRIITATYSESIRQYTVKYVSKGVTLQSTVGLYDEIVPYIGDTPTYTAEESAYKYHLFSHWDKSGLVDGDKTINAVFETCEYTSGYFDDKELSTLSHVELYALMKLGLEQNVLSIKDSMEFKIGNDYSYEDIPENTFIVSDTKFDGTNVIDTNTSLMEIDRDWTIAFDFEFAAGNTNGATLLQCFQSDGSNGFKLWWSNGVKLSWGVDSTTPATGTNRELVVIRHKKGSKDISVFMSNIHGDDILSDVLTAIRIPVINSTIVFGASKADDGIMENHCKGTLHWCKIWYKDLGDDLCKSISQWTHEIVPVELAKFKGYYTSDADAKRASMTFLASNLLGINASYSKQNDTEGGWATSTLNTKLNTRLYKAISPLWKALIKPVKVYSSIGKKSLETSVSNCYFYIPSVYEVDDTYSKEPYINETNAPISYMINNDVRKRSKVATPDVFESYWTRSPNIEYANYLFYVNETGAVSGYIYPSHENSILLMFSIGV